MSELRARIRTNQLDKGETLWQGGKHGLCILNESCNRDSKRPVSVLSLDNPKSPLSFKSDYLLPMKELLEMHVIPTTVLSNKERMIIMYIITEILQNIKMN
jgi:hypothetical protein